MTARILNGLAIAKSIRQEVGIRVQQIVEQHSVRPGLTVILVGQDPASELYVKLKKRDCEAAGIHCEIKNFAADISESQLTDTIDNLNENPAVHGILLQLPLPETFYAPRIVERIDPIKDVDGITPLNMGKLALREPAHRCCTPKGVMTLLDHTGIDLLGLDAVVVGASNHVGRPMCLELLLRGCTVTCTHKYSRDTSFHTRQADILVTATGIGGLIRQDWVKPGAIVIDVGIETQPDGRLKGDVEYEEVKEVASWLTPVPGGVGPMTRVSILQNLLTTVEQSLQ